MKIHTFIFTWLDHYKKAMEYEKVLNSLSSKVTVINSNEKIASTFPHWIHLNDGYYTEQWYTAIQNFNEDIFFHIQADTDFDDFSRLFEKSKYAFEKYKCGIYSPNVNHTSWVYPYLSNLKQYETNLYEVPQTDQTCWFLSKEIINRFPYIDISINKHGWFIDYVCIIISRELQMPVLRDYSFEISHKNFTGYSHDIARAEFEKTKQFLGEKMETKINLLTSEAFDARIENP